MSAMRQFLGLESSSSLTSPPYHTGPYLIFHFLWAYAFTSSRVWKMAYKIDHNVSPREDLTKYGPAAVSKGKITQKQLDQLKRVEASHANSMEHFPILATAVVLAHVAGLRPEVVNSTLLSYTIARVLYVIFYVNTTRMWASWFRGVAWWSSSIFCMRLIYKAGEALNAKTV